MASPRLQPTPTDPDRTPQQKADAKTMLQTHSLAMDSIDQGLALCRQGHRAQAHLHLYQALALALESLEWLRQLPYREPTYSVMHRSTATLALDCQRWALAERLAQQALGRTPPSEIAQELEEVLEKAQQKQGFTLLGRLDQAEASAP